MLLKEAVKNTRMEALLSQEEFAKELQVSVISVNRWENGKAKPNLKAMRALKAFCVKHALNYLPIEETWLSYKTAK